MRRRVVQYRISVVSMAELVEDAAIAKPEPQARAFALLVVTRGFNLG